MMMDPRTTRRRLPTELSAKGADEGWMGYEYEHDDGRDLRSERKAKKRRAKQRGAKSRGAGARDDADADWDRDRDANDWDGEREDVDGEREDGDRASRQRTAYQKRTTQTADLSRIENEGLETMVRDKRVGWRQTGAKRQRRNRRYAKRLLNNLDLEEGDDDDEDYGGDDAFL